MRKDDRVVCAASNKKESNILELTKLPFFTGLTSSWKYPIYCSEITKILLVQRHGVQEQLIHSLEVSLN